MPDEPPKIDGHIWVNNGGGGGTNTVQQPDVGGSGTVAPSIPEDLCKGMTADACFASSQQWRRHVQHICANMLPSSCLRVLLAERTWSHPEPPKPPPAKPKVSGWERFAGVVGGCASGAVIGEFAADTALFVFIWTGIPEIAGPIGGCIIGGYAGYEGAGDVVDAGAAGTGK